MDERSVTALKGIGDKTGKLLSVLGVHTVEDLVRFYPSRYDSYPEITAVDSLIPGGMSAISCQIFRSPSTVRAGKLKITQASAEDITGKIRCVWYNSPYIANTLHRDTEYVFSGRIKVFKGRKTIEHPIVYRKEEYLKLMSTLRPVYRLCKGIT